MEMNVLLTVSPTDSRHNYVMNRMIFAFFGSSSCVVDCDWWRSFFETEEYFPFSWSRLLFVAKQSVPSQPNNTIVAFGP